MMNWLNSRLMEGEGGDGSANGGGGSTTLLAGAGGGGTPPSAFTPSYDGVLGADGAFTDGWTAKAFGADYNGPLAGVKSLADVNKVLADNMAAARGKVPTMPGEKATAEEIAAWRKITGAPETPDKYGDLRPETIPEAMWDKANEAKLQALAHKHHLPPSAIKDIVGLYGETLGEGVKKTEAEIQANRAGELNTLKAEFGKDFDSSMHAAKRFALTIGLNPESDPMFNSAAAVIAMAKAAKLVSEDKLINGQTQGLSGTPQMQANAIMTDTANPLYAKYQAGDRDTVALVNNLLMQGGNS
jgi:hypothetical protein